MTSPVVAAKPDAKSARLKAMAMAALPIENAVTKMAT
jgi:hypothetical protein